MTIYNPTSGEYDPFDVNPPTCEFYGNVSYTAFEATYDILDAENNNAYDAITFMSRNSQNTDVTLLVYTLTVLTDAKTTIYISPSSTGLLTSVLWGTVDEIAGPSDTVQERVTQNNDNYVITIEEDAIYTEYELVITFNNRAFSVTVDANMIAEEGTDGVQTGDKLTLVLAHAYYDNLTSSWIIDKSYTANINNDNKYVFNNITVLDNNGIVSGKYFVYIYHPMFYDYKLTTLDSVNNISYSGSALLDIVKDNENVDFTLYESYDQSKDLSVDNVATYYLGSFKLDTLTTDIEINITIHKPYEYWLHANR
jgi:hypothetical protein